jgi:predicted lysophospholipase L1 biosynthesis ABC-type transport system permease subunit
MSAAPDTGLRIAAAVLAWLAGIGWQMQQPALWPQAHYLAMLLAALALYAAWLARPRRGIDAVAASAFTLCLLLALAFVGFASTGLRAAHRLAQTPARRTGRPGCAAHRRHRGHAATRTAGYALGLSGGAGAARRATGAGARAGGAGLVSRFRR